mmetsp:Transcript_13552/g.13132  ORF Transcript_13552/g.13132 Transcript_13552/m.13132 type:complete len:281 (-) Transcript_13552:196-1038(-)|eukprot:CAMPEP_0197837768 /NCGR_PEP_ID=MMETSP1437-20131217/33269_1 /TAXON_ID=49252 ORGANISM="Eucampia antarctica, Strain CCMP1452" /NCGR_SAMPLE_ID=MMETSP1437 /ASSEMBLY_ACC=CAM_ASM_001096 /LENGTH=280 /DNA_ID=CAMNT_0043445095 /DNA_START=44 /DNA_END=886 /DNA_ORIENTATION=+
MAQYQEGANLDELDVVSRGILSFISFLDESLGADTWTSRQVAVTSGVIFLCLQYQIGKKRGILVYSLLHALLSGVGSTACVYLDFFASETLTGAAEPLRSAACMGGGPLTSLHAIVPAITLGYSICDTIHGMSLGGAFLAHGIATFSVMLLFTELGMPQIVNTMLVMEQSTIILSVLKADFLAPSMQLLLQASFAVSFFFCRILLAPYIWYEVIKAMYPAVFIDHSNTCYPAYLFYATFAFGMFFHCLNSFWFVKIIAKMYRKLSGKEAIGDTKVNEHDN